MATIKELLEKREASAKAIEEMNRKVFNTEGYEPTAEDEKRWAEANAEFTKIDGQLKRAQDMENVQTRMKVGTQDSPPVSSHGEGDESRARSHDPAEIPEHEARMMAMVAWAAVSVGREPTERQVQACRQLRINPGAKHFDIPLLDTRGVAAMQREHRAAIGTAPQTVTTTGGGYAIPQGFVAELERAMLAFGGMRQACRIIRTSTGNQLDWPTIDDTSNTGALLGINTAAAEVAVTLGQKQLDAYKFSSNAVTVPFELLQDSAFDLNTELASILGERIGRVENTYFTTGTGSSQPQGISAASGGAATGKTAASATAFTYEELIDLMHSVDSAYRNNPGVAFMFHDLILAEIRKLQDGDGNPLWGPNGLTQAPPQVLLGKPFIINNDLPSTLTSTYKIIFFGDWNKFVIREVAGIRMKRLEEIRADYDQVVFLAFTRGDSEYIGSGGGAIKCLALA